MKLSLKIAIVEPSVMVRTGLGTLLRKLSGMQITVVEILKVESLLESLRIHKPDVLIACPQLLLQSAQNLHFGMSARSMDHNCLTPDPACSNGHI